MSKRAFSAVYGLSFPALLAARLALALTSLPEMLKYDHQLSSPLTSFSQLREGVYLFQHGIDPYSGGTFRHSPMLLSLFATILPNSRKISALVWVLCDVVGAYALVSIWRARQGVLSSPRDRLIAAMYLMNPYLFLPNLALSTSCIENTLMLLSVMFASIGKKSASLLSLSFLFLLAPSTIMVLVPILLLLVSDPASRLSTPQPSSASLKKVLPLLCEFLIYTCILVYASTFVCGNWNWVTQAWAASLTLPDLTPNPGLWWYFFTEMFDYFRPFFLIVFSVHMIIYIAPMCMKFQHDPLYATFLLIGILGTFKSYLTLSDPGLFLSMIAIFPEIFPYFRHPIVTALLHLHASMLLPLFHHLWLNQGTGNANFFYASTLVFALSNGAALTDCIWAGMRIAIGEDTPTRAAVQE